MDTEAKDNPGIPEAWKANIKSVLFTEAQIKARIEELAAALDAEYAGKKVLAVGLLNGALVFVADLLRRVRFQYKIDFMVASSYSGTESTGNVRIKKDLSLDPAGYHVLVIEDIVDTGVTLKWLYGHLESLKPASVKIVTLLNKTARRTVDVPVHFSGFECPDEFVVGYGMDFENEYRCLPFVGVLKPEAYKHLG